ncbi:MAG TPA: ABC transporter ATP-binding protein [Salinarimonas sp.]|nr:ABC transporter ATP-binding protein [Salinarimonas sp.]
MSEPILRVEGVVAGYGRMTILDGTTLSVERGAVTTVIGPNGAGKSTLFKALFGLLPVREGRVLLEGEEVTNWTPARLLAAGVVYVPQGRNIFPQLSVRHNLELGATTAIDHPDMKRRLAAALDRFPALAGKAEVQASTLSGGQQKLLEIARALLLDPRLVLIDEPSIGLSPLMVREVFTILRDLAGRGVTVLMVEQNARSALAMSDYGIVLELGRARMTGRAADILADPRVGRLFLGGSLDERVA